MAGVIEPAASGRAKCKGCGRAIPKGELRLGERMPNPYGEGEATAWFHLVCGACRRPQTFAEARSDAHMDLPDAEFLDEAVVLGSEHPRLPRLATVQRSPTGRARCRHCRESIAKGTWRFVLQMWEDGRFAPIGFIHAKCAAGYFATARTDHLVARTRRLTPEVTEAELAEISQQLRLEQAPVGDGS